MSENLIEIKNLCKYFPAGKKRTLKAVDNVSLNKLEGRTYTDYASYSYRLDGNNVDIDTENVELASEQLRYQTLTSAVSNEFTRMNTAMQTP